MSMMKSLARSVAYLKARFDERSTWAAISAGIIGASALAEPWSYVAAAVGVLGAVIPTSGGSDA